MPDPVINPFTAALMKGGLLNPAVGPMRPPPALEDVDPDAPPPRETDIGPQGAFAYDVGTMSPADAARIVSRSLTAGSVPLELNKYRDQRMGELEDRRAGDILAGDVRDRGAAEAYMGSLQHDIDTDPDTGLEAHKRIRDVRDAIDQAALVQRGEVGDAANAISKRNAFAKFLDKQAGYQADISPPGRIALSEANERKIREIAAASGGKLKLSAEGTKAVTALHQAYDLGTQLHAILTNPNTKLGQAATDRGDSSLPEQLVDAAGARVNRTLYSWGVRGPEGYNEATQLAEMMKVLATAGLLRGVRNMEWINQIQDHLAQGRLPPRANLERLELFLKQAPNLENDIYDVEFQHEPIGVSFPTPAAAPAAGPPAAPTLPPAQAYAQYGNRPAPAAAAPPAADPNAGRYQQYLRTRR